MHPLRTGTDILGKIIARAAAITDEYLEPYRPELFGDAAERRASALNLPSLEAYLAYLERDPHEPCAMLDEAFVGVTGFFRDPAAFDALAHHLSARFSTHKKALQAYVAACSTGQEALSVFFLLERLRKATDLPEPAPLLATDINPHAIDTAREGIYSDDQLHGLSASMRRQFFTPHPRGFQLAERYRRCLHFEVRDVIRRPPAGRFDLICCRNLLIYLQPAAQLHLLNILHRALCPGGLLFLGAYESAAPLPGLFAPVDTEHSIYARRP